MHRHLTRRELLKWSSAAVLGLALPGVRKARALRPLPPEDHIAPEADLTGRVTIDYLRLFRRPSFESRQTGWFGFDDLLPIYRTVSGARKFGHPTDIWYETSGGYVYSIDVQPTTPRLNSVTSQFPSADLGLVGEITVPFTDAIWKHDKPDSFAYRLYYDGVFWVTGLELGADGTPLYQLFDERLGLNYYVPAAHVRIVPQEELTPIAPDVEDKRIVVNLDLPQRLTAFEENTEVFSTLISGGRWRFAEDIAANGGFRSLTPEGYFRIERKKPSRHMGFGEYASDYELPGVGWVSYTHWKGYAFHSTYWHNNFGYPRSAGCINMTLPDARWLFRWTMPIADFGLETTTGSGTPVQIG